MSNYLFFFSVAIYYDSEPNRLMKWVTVASKAQ